MSDGRPSTTVRGKPEICKSCPAYNDHGPVWSSPPTRELRAIIVGEAPGVNEVDQGKGFVGPSGGLLWSMTGRVGLRREECFVTNVAKCLTKHPGAFKFCSEHFLLKELETLPDNIPIIALGDEAKKVLAPDLNPFTITTARGCKSGRVICALHPAFIRRSIRQGAEEDKQDLSPTLAWDISEGVNHPIFPPNRDYVTPIPLPEKNFPFVSCDLETANTLDPRHGPIDQIGFGIQYGQALREKYKEENRELYQRYLKENKVVFHNMLFDLDWLEYNDYEIPDPEDTMGAAHLLDPDFPLGLDFQNTLYVHYKPWKSSKRRDEHGYHATDLDVTYQCWDRMSHELRQRGLWELYEKEWKPVTLACLKMKQGGIKIDRRKMMILNIALARKVEQIDTALVKLANIDWGSPKQVMEVLYDRWKLPIQMHRKSGKPTTDADALEELAGKHPSVDLLRMRRQIDKMRSTYTDYNLDEKDFLHSDVSFTAATGRARGFLLTLQRGAMRSLFVPDEPGWKMAYADWDRVELWISAVLSGDKHFQEILEKVNFHEYCGSEVFGKVVSKKTTPEEYHSTKFITHGINFGRGEASIERDHEIPRVTTRKFIEWMNREFPYWAQWRQREYNTAITEGRLTNPFGFSRYFWSGNIKSMAYSFGPQSVPAHMMKRVVPQMMRELPKPARLLLPVHDATLVTYPEEIESQVLECMREVMTQAWPQLGGWKAGCSIGIGKNFQECSED